MRTEQTHTERNNRSAPEDKFAEESFTFRRMRPYQIWAAAIAAVAVLVIGFALA